ncbi:MAG: hypothetical protein MUP36_03715, partial [Demequinaceae bacterium]|nr:hypothetical protein [Demequinaceae bacterium]
MSESITVIGGVGGTHARLADLEKAARLLAIAATELSGIGRAVRAAGWAVSRIEVAPERVPARERAVDRLAWVDQGSGGATSVAREADGLAVRLRQTIKLIEDAERVSQSIWTKAGRFWDKTVSL